MPENPEHDLHPEEQVDDDQTLVDFGGQSDPDDTDEFLLISDPRASGSPIAVGEPVGSPAAAPSDPEPRPAESRVAPEFAAVPGSQVGAETHDRRPTAGVESDATRTGSIEPRSHEGAERAELPRRIDTDLVGHGNASRLGPMLLKAGGALLGVAIIAGILWNLGVGRAPASMPASSPRGASSITDNRPPSAGVRVNPDEPSSATVPDLVDEGNAAIIYQADWTAGLNGWPATAGWSSTGALLQNDGSDFGDANWLGGLWNLHWVAAPYAPPPSLANYAIEAEVQVMRRPQCGSFGVVAGGAYQIGLHMCSADSPPTLSVRAHNPQLSARSNSPQLLANLPLDPGDGWHLYRIELDGPDLHVLVDGVVVADIHDAGAGPAGPVGLWDDHTELAVRAFRVLGL